MGMQMNGMAMMIKSLGVDPTAIQKGIEVITVEIPAKVEEFEKTIKDIHLQNAQILLKLARLEVLLCTEESSEIELTPDRIVHHPINT